MSKFRSLVFMGIGAAAISYGAYNYSTRFSDDNIWGRQQAQIERIFRTESRAPGRAPLQKAEEQRRQRYDELRGGLSELGSASGEERCRFETRFSQKVLTGSREAGAEAISRDGYTPFPQCRSEERLQHVSVMSFLFPGALFMLYGIYRFIRSIGTDTGKKELEKRRKALESDRRDALLKFGFAPAHAKSITDESIRGQSAYDTLSANMSATSVLRVFEGYGFCKGEIQRLMLILPGLLNRTPADLCAKLSALEDGGAKAPDQVRKDIMRLPGLLE